MRFAFALVAILVSLPGCFIYFDDEDDDPPCYATGAPEVPPQRLINPETLACESFSQPTCNDSCGPCPLGAAGAIYIPPWGSCESPCVGMPEAACNDSAECRVVRDYDRYYDNATADSFAGCYPLSEPAYQNIQAEDCEDVVDAQQCSSRVECTALHRNTDSPCGANVLPEQCIGTQFMQCITETQSDAGTCTTAACRSLPPECPTGTTPGVANGCWTGACIPNEFCGIVPF